VGGCHRRRRSRPANAAAIRNWCVDYWEATHPYSTGGSDVNFIIDEGQERVQATYRGNYRRFAQMNSEYDHESFFRVNQTPTRLKANRSEGRQP